MYKQTRLGSIFPKGASLKLETFGHLTRKSNISGGCFTDLITVKVKSSNEAYKYSGYFIYYSVHPKIFNKKQLPISKFHTRPTTFAVISIDFVPV